MKHSTDCAAVYLGFGVLLTNAARHTETHIDVGGMGWRSWTAGYLSEPALATATAMFAALHRYPIEDAVGALKPQAAKGLVRAGKAVAADFPDFARTIENIDLSDWS